MGIFIILSLIVVTLTYSFFNLNDQYITYQDYEEKWWGPDELRGKNDSTIRPYSWEFDGKMIGDLRQRLIHCRPPVSTFDNVGFEYGFNSRQLPNWLHYWANEYPFKERRNFLNQFPQFITNVQGLDIHFIGVSPKIPAGVNVRTETVMLLHGWPGSVREFYEAIPLLTAYCPNRDYALELIIPSLPGFGPSQAAVRPGLCAAEIAKLMRNLMKKLGYKKFYVQGGDWGSFIGANMATMFPEEILGYHSNLPYVFTSRGLLMQALGDSMPSLIVAPNLVDRMYPLIDKLMGMMNEFGYLHLQATKPDTLGIALSDSPAGLLAYLFQFFSSGTRHYYMSREDGGLDHYPMETLVDNLMIYWVSGCITSSFRIYAETINKDFAMHLRSAPTNVPTWVVQAKYEIGYQSPAILKTKFTNLLHTTVLEEEGHFLALEKPKLFADDVLEAIGAFRNWHRERGEQDC